MTRHRQFVDPPIWDDEILEADRRRAVTNFISERMAEGGTRYRQVFAENLASVERLFAATNDLQDFGAGTALAMTPSLIRAARFLSGPPVSQDDLNTLAEASIATRRRLDADLARKAASVIQTAIDAERFPWLFQAQRRPATPSERETAVRWTAGLMTAQQVQTGRRGASARQQEQAVEQVLTDLEFVKVARRPINAPTDLAPGEFCRESIVVRAKCDVPVRLRDGRLLLVECKASNSAANSVKRLNRECGDKAGQWRGAFGDHVITAAVLAGVFRLRNLQDAQAMAGVAIFWEHSLTALADFVRAAV